MRAFYIFAAYISHDHPELQQLLKYAEIIATLADPGHGYTLAEWMAYDVRFRLHMPMNFSEHHLWSAMHKQVWREIRFQVRVNAPIRALGSIFGGTSKLIGCFLCGEDSHHQRSCSYMLSRPVFGSAAGLQPFYPSRHAGNKCALDFTMVTTRHHAGEQSRLL